MSKDSKNQVVVYTADWCAFCHAAKQYLDQKKVKYMDKNVEKDPQAGLEALNKSQQRGIPVIDIGGVIIVGFDRPKIDAALREKKLV